MVWNMENIDKQQILNAMIARLKTDVLILEQAVQVARDTATHADCLGSSKYETMGLEASYLAQGQGTRLLDVERTLEYFLRLHLLPSEPAIGLSSLVALDDEAGHQQLLWLATEAGGLKVQHDGLSITVITPKSPLGHALIGKAIHDEIEISMAGNIHSYEIAAIY
jgi:hypothetical protein